MQGDYNNAVFNAQLEKIQSEFSNLKPSADKLGKSTATNAEEVAKAHVSKKGKAIIFEIQLSSTSTLLGYDLGRRTKKFVKKIGRANGAVLPYCVTVEKG